MPKGTDSYYIHQGNKSDEERKILRKKSSFMHTKRFNTFLKRWVQFRVYHDKEFLKIEYSILPT